MSLVSSKDILLKAQREGYAVGAFNAENMEMVQAIVSAAEESSSPVIIQTTPGSLQYADTDLFFGMVNAVAGKAKVPVALHLDHGNSAELCAKALRSGYTSIMIDGSKLPFAENVELTKKVVEFTHAMGVPVEGELGTVGGKDLHRSAGGKSVCRADGGGFSGGWNWKCTWFLSRGSKTTF